jgi:hypothetical protein
MAIIYVFGSTRAEIITDRRNCVKGSLTTLYSSTVQTHENEFSGTYISQRCNKYMEYPVWKNLKEETT